MPPSLMPWMALVRRARWAMQMVMQMMLAVQRLEVELGRELGRLQQQLLAALHLGLPTPSLNIC